MSSRPTLERKPSRFPRPRLNLFTRFQSTATADRSPQTSSPQLPSSATPRSPPAVLPFTVKDIEGFEVPRPGLSPISRRARAQPSYRPSPVQAQSPIARVLKSPEQAIFDTNARIKVMNTKVEKLIEGEWVSQMYWEHWKSKVDRWTAHLAAEDVTAAQISNINTEMNEVGTDVERSYEFAFRKPDVKHELQLLREAYVKRLWPAKRKFEQRLLSWIEKGTHDPNANLMHFVFESAKTHGVDLSPQASEAELENLSQFWREASACRTPDATEELVKRIAEKVEAAEIEYQNIINLKPT